MRFRYWPWVVGAGLLLVFTCRSKLSQPTKPAHAVAPRLAIGHPEWPREVTGDAARYEPATLRFADGSSAVLYPDRVRSPWGRSMRISVERFDASGKPMTGVRDMELVVDSAGRTFKAGFTEHAAGRYTSELRGDSLAIGRTDVLLVASQSARPNEPIAMATAVISVDVLAGVRFTGPPIARRDGDHLFVDVPVTSQAAAHVTIRGVLFAGKESIGELTGQADVAEGAGVVTLDAGSLIPANDPRNELLALADVTANADGQWTDFWRGARRITDGGPR